MLEWGNPSFGGQHSRILSRSSSVDQICNRAVSLLATILDKTVEKIVYLDSIFLNFVAVPVLPSPPSPESNVVVYSKESLISGRLWEATLNRGFLSVKASFWK